MPRTATVTVPYMTALVSANSAPRRQRVRAGIGHDQHADKADYQRGAPGKTGGSSSQTKIDTKAAKSGAEKLIATAPASGIKLKAKSKQSCEIDCERPRARWSRGRCVTKADSPLIGKIIAAPATSEAKERRQSTSPTG